MIVVVLLSTYEIFLKGYSQGWSYKKYSKEKVNLRKKIPRTEEQTNEAESYPEMGYREN